MDWTGGLIERTTVPAATQGRVIRHPEPRERPRRTPGGDGTYQRKRLNLAEIPNPWGLSAHRAQIVALVSYGMTNVEIAKAIGVSKKTVEAQLASAIKQMQAHSTAVLNRVRVAVLWDRHIRGQETA